MTFNILSSANILGLWCVCMPMPLCVCLRVYVCLSGCVCVPMSLCVSLYPVCMCPLCEHKVIKLRAFQSGLCLGGDCLQSCIMNKFIVAHLGKLGLLTTLVSRKGLYC